ncbi:hypothetical protein FRE64_16885 (plasmid) [Euhalothece natronophila Z-M001]|uniref:Uncharacterized protein n=1 Tax=Euhalothece natronophila Z-M001 TaxID=522448 RepID=A0A5B8NTF3_9CHRO|nr:hypothetical protein [Euhalothece natronophila]QDZ41649.1 hypothetical protein FRE64_16885 [Euhalothece natronophila Z-M001]
MKLIDGLNYREWQKRNTELFSKLDRSQQKELRNQGYRNKGWLHVQKSWKLLKNFCQEISLFDHKLKNHDLLGAINHSILEAEQAKNVASESLEILEANYNKVKELADQALDKYQIL